MISVVLALVGALSYGIADFVGGVAARRTAALRIVAVSYPASVLLVALLVPVFGGTAAVSGLAWGAASGVFAGLAMWWFYRAMAIGPMSIVSPVTAVLVAGIPVVVGFGLGERPEVLAIVGIFVAIVAVVMVSREPGHDGERISSTAAWLAFGSGSAFGIAFVCMHQIEAGGGLYPLLASRAASTVVVWGAAIAASEFKFPPRSVLPLALLAGLLEVTATGAMMFALQGSLLSVVSVLGSLYPAATVFLAMALLKERLSRVQMIGLAGALAAVGMIAAGA